MLPIQYQTARFEDFQSSGSSLLGRAMLAGRALAEVRDIERSIAQFGLLSPILVRPKDEGSRRMIVVDGAKRLAAIRRLRFRGRLPRSLDVIPFLEVGADACMNARTASALAPELATLAPVERFEQVKALAARGYTPGATADALYIPEAEVEALLGVSRLSPRLRRAFFAGHVDLEQASAFATLPCPDSQDALLRALGPFARARDILDAVRGGATVVAVGPDEDDALILPSRAPIRRPARPPACSLAAA